MATTDEFALAARCRSIGLQSYVDLCALNHAALRRDCRELAGLAGNPLAAKEGRVWAAAALTHLRQCAEAATAAGRFAEAAELLGLALAAITDIYESGGDRLDGWRQHRIGIAGSAAMLRTVAPREACAGLPAAGQLAALWLDDWERVLVDIAALDQQGRASRVDLRRRAASANADIFLCLCASAAQGGGALLEAAEASGLYALPPARLAFEQIGRAGEQGVEYWIVALGREIASPAPHSRAVLALVDRLETAMVLFLQGVPGDYCRAMVRHYRRALARHARQLPLEVLDATG